MGIKKKLGCSSPVGYAVIKESETGVDSARDFSHQLLSTALLSFDFFHEHEWLIELSIFVCIDLFLKPAAFVFQRVLYFIF